MIGLRHIHIPSGMISSYRCSKPISPMVADRLHSARWSMSQSAFLDVDCCSSLWMNPHKVSVLVTLPLETLGDRSEIDTKSNLLGRASQELQCEQTWFGYPVVNWMITEYYRYLQIYSWYGLHQHFDLLEESCQNHLLSKIITGLAAFCL